MAEGLDRVPRIERIRALVALAIDKPDSEESRTAAVTACVEISKSGLLDAAQADAVSLPDFTSPTSIDDYVRECEARARAEAAAYGPGVGRVRWPRRTFCHRCKAIIEEGEESMRIMKVEDHRTSTRHECIRCFERGQSPELQEVQHV